MEKYHSLYLAVKPQSAKAQRILIKYMFIYVLNQIKSFNKKTQKKQI
jgi:hypothetical protein